MARQLSLLGAPSLNPAAASPAAAVAAARPCGIAFDAQFARVRRLELAHDAWLEHGPGWLRGADLLFDTLLDEAEWRSEQRWMYERLVDVPRLLARLEEVPEPLVAMSEVLSARYGRTLDRVTLAYYRDGQDSVAWHGDRIGRVRRDTVVAIVSIGEPRRFLLRPARRSGSARSMRFELGGGDLLVMGGTCQRTWEHAVPKVASAGPRISVMFREAAPET